MTDDLTRRLAEQILRGVKDVHEEHTPNEPLVPVTPVAPHAAAEQIGISPVGRWYAAALKYLEEEWALKPNLCTGESRGIRSTFWESALWSCWRTRKVRHPPGGARPSIHRSSRKRSSRKFSCCILHT